MNNIINSKLNTPSKTNFKIPDSNQFNTPSKTMSFQPNIYVDPLSTGELADKYLNFHYCNLDIPNTTKNDIGKKIGRLQYGQCMMGKIESGLKTNFPNVGVEIFLGGGSATAVHALSRKIEFRESLDYGSNIKDMDYVVVIDSANLPLGVINLTTIQNKFSDAQVSEQIMKLLSDSVLDNNVIDDKGNILVPYHTINDAINSRISKIFSNNSKTSRNIIKNRLEFKKIFNELLEKLNLNYSGFIQELTHMLQSVSCEAHNSFIKSEINPKIKTLVKEEIHNIKNKMNSEIKTKNFFYNDVNITNNNTISVKLKSATRSDKNKYYKSVIDTSFHVILKEFGEYSENVNGVRVANANYLTNCAIKGADSECYKLNSNISIPDNQMSYDRENKLAKRIFDIEVLLKLNNNTGLSYDNNRILSKLNNILKYQANSNSQRKLELTDNIEKSTGEISRKLSEIINVLNNQKNKLKK